MKFLDRLSRGVRVFRINAPMDGLIAELRGIRLALEVICREQYSVELAPDRSIEIPPGEDESYFTDGGDTDLAKVEEMLRAHGWEPPTDDERADPLGANLGPGLGPWSDKRPLMSFLDREEEHADEQSSDSILTARRVFTGASADGQERTLRGGTDRGAARSELDGEDDGTE